MPETVRVRCRPGTDGCTHVFEAKLSARGTVTCPKCKGGFKVEDRDLIPADPLPAPVQTATAPGCI